MKFRQEIKFIQHHPKENLLIPYFTDTDLKSQLNQVELQDAFSELIINQKSELDGRSILYPCKSGMVLLTFLNLGEEKTLDLQKLNEVFGIFGKQVQEDYQILLSGLTFGSYTLQQVVQTAIRAMNYGAYSFAKEKLTSLSERRIFSFRDELKKDKAELVFSILSEDNLEAVIKKAETYSEGINYARMLGDIPNNYLHVSQFADYLMDMAEYYQLSYEILGKRELKELHSGGILGVNAGSDEEAKLITIYYEGCRQAPVTALVGKGVMFDSGGYHLKSISGMQGMKYDMCGAANLAAALEIAVRQKSKKNILLIIPAVENVISPSACKMGDVLTTMSGKTVEVYNLDAEGRLILCDAITHAIKKGAGSIIDLATLTYSCQRALGNEISGIYSNNEDFYHAFENAAKKQGEKIWRLPLDESYHKPLYRTQTADLINYAPDCEGGASIAACFLEEFVEGKIPWIHLDIVGTAVHRTEKMMYNIGASGVMAASVAELME